MSTREGPQQTLLRNAQGFRLACARRASMACVPLPGVQGERWQCARAGRDLRFLIVSYGGNLALTLACLAAQQRFFAPVTIFGIWGCACL